MKPFAAPRRSASRPIASVVAGLAIGATLAVGCGPRMAPAEAPAAKTVVPAPALPALAVAPAEPTSDAAVTDATLSATGQGDPFAKVDVAADDRLRQILRADARPRVQEPKAAPRARNVAPPTAPAEPARQQGPEALAAAPPPSAAPSAAPSPAATAAPAAESVAPVAIVVPAPAAEPPRMPALRAIERLQPPFPPEAQRQGVLSGRVVAAITVLPNGSVSQVDIVESTPQRMFDRAVRNTLLRWRFEPVPQQMRANVEIVFNADR